MNYTKLENAVIEEVQNICRKYLDKKNVDKLLMITIIRLKMKLN